MDLGLVTFADLHPGVSAEERMRNLLEEAKLADQFGLNLFAVGEHHRPDYLVSSPATALAAIPAHLGRDRFSRLLGPFCFCVDAVLTFRRPCSVHERPRLELTGDRISFVAAATSLPESSTVGAGE